MEDRARRDTTAEEEPMGEWVGSETRDLADAGLQRVHEARRGTKGYAAEVKEYLQGAVQQAQGYVAGAREYVGHAVHQARDTASAYRAGGVEKVKHDVAGYTREQPMIALLIAAGAGLVLGWLSAAGRR